MKKKFCRWRLDSISFAKDLMNKCKHCQADFVLRSCKVSERLTRQTYWCPICRSQKIQSVLAVPGDGFDLDPYSHYVKIREYARANTVCDIPDKHIPNVQGYCRRKSN